MSAERDFLGLCTGQAACKSGLIGLYPTRSPEGGEPLCLISPGRAGGAVSACCIRPMCRRGGRHAALDCRGLFPHPADRPDGVGAQRELARPARPAAGTVLRHRPGGAGLAAGRGGRFGGQRSPAQPAAGCAAHAAGRRRDAQGAEQFLLHGGEQPGLRCGIWRSIWSWWSCFTPGWRAAQIHSDGFAALRNEVEARRSSRDYQTLSRQLEQTQYQIGHVKSIALGVNLDGTLRVTDVGVLSINTEKIPPGQRAGQAAGPGQGRPHGVHLRLCQPGQDRPGRRKNTPWTRRSAGRWTPPLQRPSGAGSRGDRTSISGTRPLSSVGLLDDFRFLSAAVSFLLQLRALGCPLCRPEIRPMEEKALRLKGVCNPMLALRTEGQGPGGIQRFRLRREGAVSIWSQDPTTEASPSSATRWGWPRPCSSWGCWCRPGRPS